MKLSALLFLLTPAFAQSQVTLKLTERTELPVATLEPGSYVLSIVDSLKDRKVVRVTDSTGRDLGLFLAAPNPAIRRAGSGAFVFWPAKGEATPALRAWFIPGEFVAAEAVYEKAEALALAKRTGEPVPAIDPESELPIRPKDRRLSREDLDVLKLWSLDYGPVSVEERTLKAAKLETAAWKPAAPELPRTASPYGWAVVGGLAMVGAGFFLRRRY